MPLKIGLIAFGSGVRGLVPEEESMSNAAIIEAPAYQILAERLDAQFYILSPPQKNTRELLSGSKPDLWRDHLSRFTICDKESEEPEDLDMIWIQSGSDNLRYSAKWRGIHAPYAFFMLRALKKFNQCPVVYFQTDFASPLFYSGECYGSIYQRLFPVDKLWSKRDLHVFTAGNTNISNHKKYFWAYQFSEIVKIHTFNPDLHFLIDLDEISSRHKMASSLYGVAFAGKQRQKGSREKSLHSYIQSQVPLTLAGKWKNETIRKFSASSSHFEFLGKLPTHQDVLELYSDHGATLYLSSPDYSELGVVTSRFYDALKARAIPFIDENAYTAVSKQFSGGINDLREIVVSPTSINKKIDEFQSKDFRLKFLNYLDGVYKRHRNLVVRQFEEKIMNIISSSAKVKRTNKNLFQLFKLFYEKNGSPKKYSNKHWNLEKLNIEKCLDVLDSNLLRMQLCVHDLLAKEDSIRSVSPILINPLLRIAGDEESIDWGKVGGMK